jgi:hypothetical protein
MINHVHTEIDQLRSQRLALQDEMCFQKDQIAALRAPGQREGPAVASHVAAVSDKIKGIAVKLDCLERRLAELSAELDA